MAVAERGGNVCCARLGSCRARYQHQLMLAEGLMVAANMLSDEILL
jgi:hypothetical protein